MIPYVDTRMRAWASWRMIVTPKAGQGGYYAFRTVLGDLRTESTGQPSTTRAPGSRTRAITRDGEDREPLEVELVVRYLPEDASRLTLLLYIGVPSLESLAGVTRVDAKGRPLHDTLERPRPFTIPQLESALGVCRATVYNRIQAVHGRILDALLEPRLDALVDRISRAAALDTLNALRQNPRHSAKVGISPAAA